MEALILSKAVETKDLPLETMIATNSQAILRYCHLLLRDYHEAQDVVQTTFLKAYTKRNQIKGELSPWLYRTAYNNCIDILRRRKKQSFLDDEKREPSYHMDDGMSMEVKTALGVLSPEERALVINRVMDEMSYEQLSQIYNASPQALRKRYERAKKKLADALRSQFFGTNKGGIVT